MVIYLKQTKKQKTLGKGLENVWKQFFKISMMRLERFWLPKLWCVLGLLLEGVFCFVSPSLSKWKLCYCSLTLCTMQWQTASENGEVCVAEAFVVHTVKLHAGELLKLSSFWRPNKGSHPANGAT